MEQVNTVWVEKTKEGENNQLEELSNATNGLGHVANEDETFGDEEHCKTLCWKPINSDERQSQNKYQPSHTAGSKRSREQMNKMLSKHRHIKLKKNCLELADG